MIKDEKQTREGLLRRWAGEQLQSKGVNVVDASLLKPISDDASFRRYFRAGEFVSAQTSYIFVDAPPEKEKNAAFLFVANILAEAGISVPKVISADLTQGFLMLSDMGDEMLLERLVSLEAEAAPNSVEATLSLYRQAIGLIPKMQIIQTGEIDTKDLAVYDETTLNTEMDLFSTWFLEAQLGLTLSDVEQTLLQETKHLLVANAHNQPQVFVHRDFHSRNLMLLGDEVATIDFQDALIGPITYDLVSLLKDCYWQLPRDQIIDLLQFFAESVDLQVEDEQLVRWFDLMGMQRHLKCAGIFSRLNLRDGKPGYLKDIPLVFSYLQEVSALYDDLSEFSNWLESRIAPEMTHLLTSESIQSHAGC